VICIGGMNMKKIIAYGIPVIMLTVFISIMISGQYLKRPITQEEDVEKYIDLVTKDVIDENWDKAKQNTVKLTNAWNKVIPRIQFSVERDEVYCLNLNLARLSGEITGEDKSGALAEIGDINENWKELGR
jgi:hypothetical protein